MTRRTALATAGALTIVLLAGAAVATNLGLLRITGDTGQVGQLSPADLTPTGAVRQSAPAGGTAAGGTASPYGGAVADEHDGDHERYGDDDRHDGAGRVRDGVPAHELFQGREDDD
jgi:hypothetical protein